MSDTLEKNLAALGRTSPELAQQVRDAPPAALVWEDSQQAVPTATLVQGEGEQARRITLASRFRPLEEAARLADTADLEKHAAIVLVGFGLGYHVQRLLERVAGKALLVVHEPDVSLLRAVFERLDLSATLAHTSMLLTAGDVEEAQLVGRLEGKAAYITQGVGFLTHAPTRQLHAEATRTFMERFTRFVAYCRTNVATALVNAAVTCRNLAQNLGRYAAGATVNELHNACRGYPAVLVAAGPSLAKNVHLLTQPGVRERVVIIAVQTVLKPLLDRGVRPHFVTALDYHEISRRFYEGLGSLEDVTLVAEPKANPAILESYPGPIRVLHSRFLDLLLGPLARPITPIRAGSTVAHLSLYLAQHLGCDPIMLIGQDLGFSDGLYYCPGTAIHDVWATELNAFNTLEMMEWKRIARHKAHLRKLTDVHGKPIYSDEQMVTYLKQFERDFADAPQQIIDATEGGLPKAHTKAMALREALDEHAVRPLPPLPGCAAEMDAVRLGAVTDYVRRRLEEVRELRQATQLTEPILRGMLEDQRSERRMGRHFEALARQQRRVKELDAAFGLVGELNQVGAFKRLRADRAIRVSESVNVMEKQRLQIERDIENLSWLVEGCDETLTILGEALERLEAQIGASSAATVAAGGAA